MANIIRCKLPEGVKRFKPFTVSDYRDFLMVRNDMTHKSEEEQSVVIDELTQDYFDDLPETYRHYAFLSVFTGSIGKTKIPIAYECPVCGKKHKRLFNIAQAPLERRMFELSNEITLTFNIPKEVNGLEPFDLFIKCVDTVINFENEYKWTDLSEGTQSDILDLIDMEKFDEIIGSLYPINFSMVVSCCNKDTLVFKDLKSIFKLLINPDEVFQFYEINHILSKNGYNLNSVMEMIPVERSFALALVEKDAKR